MIVIGRRDRIDFPELGITNIEAKVDTGAYGSALHCHHVEVINKNGLDFLTFKVLDPTHPEYEDKVISIKTFKDKIVKSSSGESEHRYTFKTTVTIFNEMHLVEFSLTNRDKMKYPILLGRKFLKEKFLVDVHQKDLSFQLKK
jgi:hypothetical protein